MSAATHTDPAQRLLHAVRQHLWRAQFAGAVRFATWCSAVSMLVFAAVGQLAQVAVSLGNVLVSIAALWVSLLGWAVSQRPRQTECALWADRHLGGASAYTTLLEIRNATELTQRAEALRRLEQWAASHAVRARKLLATQREPAYLLRPLVAMFLAGGIAALLLSMPGVAPTARPDLARSGKARAADREITDAPPVASPRDATELAKTLRAAASRDASAHDAVRQQPGTTGAPSMSEETGRPNAASRSGAPSESRASDPQSTVIRNNDAPGQHRSSGLGSGAGSAAGDSRDERVSVPGASTAPGAIALQLLETGDNGATSTRRADMTKPGFFAPELTPRAEAGSRLERLPLAATPPTAASEDVLAPAQVSYVEAWLKMKAERRR